MEGRREGCWILWFSEVTLFVYNASTILANFVAECSPVIDLSFLDDHDLGEL